MTLIAAILVFNLIVFVHEAGHFAAARLGGIKVVEFALGMGCLLYTSDAADDLLCVDLGGRRIIKKKKNNENYMQKFIHNDTV